nr:hypothetical protein [Tanacetum cinerariifolium]
MSMIIDQQVALDKALVSHASRLRIGKSNFHLRSDITSKESTLQVVYDVLRLTLFYKVFLVTTDVPEIYMQQFWATATVYHHSIRFKMNNKKRIVNLEYFREMLHICPRIPNQKFDELSFEEEILAFLRYIRHSGEIKKITDVNINKLHQPWRSFATVINNCLSGKSTGYDTYKEYYAISSGATPPKTKASVRKTQSSFDTTMPPPTAAGTRLLTSAKGKQPAMSSIAKVLCFLNTDERTDIIPGVLDAPTDESDEEISWKSSDEDDDDNDVDEQSEADDDDDQEDEDEQDDDQDDNDDDQESDNDVENYDDESNDDESHGMNVRGEEGPDAEDDDEEMYREININLEGRDIQMTDVHTTQVLEDTHVTLTSVNPDDEQDDDDQDDNDDDQESDNDVENSDDESNDDESHGMNVRGEEGPDAEDDDEEMYREININLEGRDIQMTDVHTTQVLEDTHVTLTSVNPDGIDSLFESTPWVDVPITTTIVSLLVTAPTLPPPSIPIMSQVQQAPVPLPTTAPSSLLQDIPNFGSLFGFDHRLKTLEANFSEFMQTNQFAGAVSSIPAQAENEDFLNKLDENFQKIINEQVKEQVKVQVSKILPKIEKTVNKQLEAEVLTRSSNSSKTSYVVAADLSKLELKKILIKKIESNKRHDDADKDKEPSARSYRGSKQRREGKEPESTSAPKEMTSKTTGQSTEGSKSYQKIASEFAPAEEPMQTTQDLEDPSHQEFKTGTSDDQPIAEASQHPEWFQKQKKPLTLDRAWNKTLPATHGSIQPWISDLAKQANTRASFNELMVTPVDFSAFLMNRLNVDTLTPELLAGLTYELMKGSCKSLVELEFFLEEVYKATTDELDWNNPEGHQYPHNLLKPLPLIPNSRGRRVIPFDHFINNDLEYLCDGASSRKYTTSVTKTKATDYGHIKWIEDLIIEWHDYKHLDWITMRRDDDKLYKFKEGDFKRLRIQDTKNMLLLLIQGKLTNLTIEKRFAFNVSLRMFTRSIVIQRCVEDLQLGVESYQKKLNLTKPDMYRTDLKRKEAYTAYSTPRGFIYQNKDKQNRLIQIDELHKFSDGTLNDVRNALDDHLKGIRMKYLPKSIWRRSEKERAAAMIQAIDKQLKTRRIMQSLKKFIGGRLYEGDFKMLQWTIRFII